MEWWDLTDDDIEGGALEFDCRLELHVYRRLDDGKSMAAWLSDDAVFFRRVSVGEA